MPWSPWHHRHTGYRIVTGIAYMDDEFLFFSRHKCLWFIQNRDFKLVFLDQNPERIPEEVCIPEVHREDRVKYSGQASGPDRVGKAHRIACTYSPDLPITI